MGGCASKPKDFNGQNPVEHLAEGAAATEVTPQEVKTEEEASPEPKLEPTEGTEEAQKAEGDATEENPAVEEVNNAGELVAEEKNAEAESK